MLFKYKHNDDTLNNVIYPAGLLIIYVQNLMFIHHSILFSCNVGFW